MGSIGDIKTPGKDSEYPPVSNILAWTSSMLLIPSIPPCGYQAVGHPTASGHSVRSSLDRDDSHRPGLPPGGGRPYQPCSKGLHPAISRILFCYLPSDYIGRPALRKEAIEKDLSKVFLAIFYLIILILSISIFLKAARKKESIDIGNAGDGIRTRERLRDRALNPAVSGFPSRKPIYTFSDADFGCILHLSFDHLVGVHRINTFARK